MVDNPLPSPHSPFPSLHNPPFLPLGSPSVPRGSSMGAPLVDERSVRGKKNIIPRKEYMNSFLPGRVWGVGVNSLDFVAWGKVRNFSGKSFCGISLSLYSCCTQRFIPRYSIDSFILDFFFLLENIFFFAFSTFPLPPPPNFLKRS